MATWMSDMHTVLQNKRLNEIVLPGTHDSAAYQVDFKPKFKSRNGWLNLITSGCLRKWPCIQSLIRNWTITQDMNLYEQLDSGIRVLDLRISYLNDQFYLTHTFINDTLENGLAQIYDFVQEYSSEIILIKFTHDHQHRHKMNSQLANKFMNIVHHKLNEFIYKPTRRLPKYKELLNMKKNVLIFYDHERAWNLANLRIEWLNQPNPTSFEDELMQYLQEPLSTNYWIQGFFYTITPNTDSITSGLFSKDPSSLKALNYKILEDFDAFWPYMMSSSNTLVMLDFPTPGIIQTLIDANL